MSRKKNADEEVKHKSTKEEIEAAVNACYGNPKERITVDIPGIPSGEDEQVFTGVLPSIESKDKTSMEEETPGLGDPDCPPPPPEPTGWDESHPAHECPCDCDGEDCACEEKVPTEPDGKPNKDKFFSDCHDLKITAGDCHYWSGRSSDPSINQYLQGINKKIFNETQCGGYSTNVTIRVVQNDWVNVSHIMDWYKARGFEVLNYKINNSPINMDTGVIEHNFTISWAV